MVIGSYINRKMSPNESLKLHPNIVIVEGKLWNTCSSQQAQIEETEVNEKMGQNRLFQTGTFKTQVFE